MKKHIIIPARYQSSRLPAKPLLEINSRPMIWHVYQRALESGISSITVATDDLRIRDAVLEFGGDVVMTSPEHLNGTDRLAEVVVVKKFDDDDIVVNLQGDEPLVPASLASYLANILIENPNSGMATLGCAISDSSMLTNPNVVKIVKNKDGQALYFSRASIPWDRDDLFFNEDFSSFKPNGYFRHIGMYSYRVSILKAISKMKPSYLELLESLEQLRPLYEGVAIQVGEVSDAPPHGVDTQDDFERIKKMMKPSV